MLTLTRREFQMDLTLLLRFIPDACVILDTDFYVLECSHAYEKSTMVKREDILGHYILDVFPDNAPHTITANMRTVKTLTIRFTSQ
jgi:transcriptional regulator with PAS, ATPase and Fis domain